MKFKEMDLDRRKQVENQVSEFENRFKNTSKDYDTVDIILTPNFTLKNYLIHKDVFQSDKMVSVEFARWINYNKGEYANKTVMDMFCGGGIQGIVALMNGAKNAIFVDYSEKACKNTLANLKQYKLTDRAIIIQSDLFSNVNKKADFMIANPPFFPSEGIEGKIISNTMCMPTKKLEEFYQKIHVYSPKVVICHWDFAGNENDPERIGAEYGWKVDKRVSLKTGYGLQQVSRTDKEYFFKVVLLSEYGLHNNIKKLS